MTRDEFINDVTTFGDLIDFCYEEDCPICEDVYDETGRDDTINTIMVDYARDLNWEELREELCNITDGYDYYLHEGGFDWTGLTDADFEDYKMETLDWMDDGNYWAEPEDEEVYYVAPPVAAEVTPDEDEDLDPIEDEDISVTELFAACSQGLETIIKEDTASISEEEFKELFFG